MRKLLAGIAPFIVALMFLGGSHEVRAGYAFAVPATHLSLIHI